jgi:hypothetical protein
VQQTGSLEYYLREGLSACSPTASRVGFSAARDEDVLVHGWDSRTFVVVSPTVIVKLVVYLLIRR